MTRMLFLHGAGGFDDDRPLADALGYALNAQVRYPRLPAEDMSFEAWAAPIRAELDAVHRADRIIAHSFGASMLLCVLAESPRAAPDHAVLLAMPDWSREGWDVADYACDGPPPPQHLTLHHCRDDAIVPFAHMSFHASRFPRAVVREHPTGGHQFDGLVPQIAASVG